jgi:hypothetical protein
MSELQVWLLCETILPAVVKSAFPAIEAVVPGVVTVLPAVWAYSRNLIGKFVSY